VISVDKFNQGPAELLIVIPTSAKDKGIRSHVRIDPPEGGVRYPTFIKCEAIRSITTDRLIHRMGSVGEQTMSAVTDIVKVLIGIY
jgi:mRNA interferase MazF